MGVALFLSKASGLNTASSHFTSAGEALKGEGASILVVEGPNLARQAPVSLRIQLKEPAFFATESVDRYFVPQFVEIRHDSPLR